MTMNKYPNKTFTAFWKNVQKPDSFFGCWIWVGTYDKGGYGRFGSQTKPAHRAMWEMLFGEIENGMHILHKCDNRGCVNPLHLFLGTNYDNIQDKWAKGRGVVPGLYGENHGMAKLTNEEVRKLREKHSTGRYLLRELASEFGINEGHVSAIVNYKTRIKAQEMDTLEKTNRELVDEQLQNLAEAFEEYDKNQAEIVDTFKNILDLQRKDVYEALVFRGYVYDILQMNGPITIPGELRAHRQDRKYIIRHTENDDGSCTIEIEYATEDEENNENTQ